MQISWLWLNNFSHFCSKFCLCEDAEGSGVVQICVLKRVKLQLISHVQGVQWTLCSRVAIRAIFITVFGCFPVVILAEDTQQHTQWLANYTSGPKIALHQKSFHLVLFCIFS